MDGINVGGKTLSIWELLIILGGLLAFISIFLEVANISMTVFGHTETTTSTATGLLSEDGTNFIAMFPLIAGILGILVILLAVVGTFTSVLDAKIVTYGELALSALVVILMIVFMISVGPGLYEGNYKTAVELAIEAGAKYSASIGTYLSLVGGVLGLAGSAMKLKE